MSGRRFTRQIATIVSVDAVGFSRMMGLDDEIAVAAFEARRDLMSACCLTFGGRMFGPAGDSMMAEFGAPVEALLCALEFQRGVAELNGRVEDPARMSFRIGINTGQVIVRDESRYGDDVNIAARLQEMASPGGVVISETTWHNVRQKTRARFADLGEMEFHNILLPVRAFRVEECGEGDAAEIHARPSGFAFFRSDGKGGPPAIAVLPFRIESADPEMRYMAEGISEDIITGLSNTRWLPVIAMSSSIQFRDDRIDAETAGRRLGARYVVSGAVSRSGDQLRVRAALDDASTNRTIWSRRLDRDMDAIVDLQGEIGGEIVSMLEKEVDRVEQARTFRVPWESLENWQLVRRGRWHLQRRTREDAELAYGFFKAAYDRDPNSSTVLNELAWWHFWRAWLRFGEAEDYREDFDHVVDYSRKALYVDSQDARPHAHLGITDIMLGRPRSAIDHLGEALRINPSFAFAYSAIGSGHLLLSDYERAIPCFQQADRLSPFDHYRFHNQGELASALFFVKRWDAAIAAADRSLALAPSYWYARFVKIAALGRSGRVEEARREQAILEARHEGFSPARVEVIPFVDKAANAALVEAYREALDARADMRQL